MARSAPATVNTTLGTPEFEARVVSVGTSLFLAADLFYFAGWWFSFFYLRALNLNSSWMPKGISPPPIATGIAVLILVILMAASYWFFTRVATGTGLFTVLGILSILLGLAAVFLQGYRQWNLGFGLTDGGYASVYAGLMGSWVLQLFAAVLWKSTNVVQSTVGSNALVRRKEAGSFGSILIFLAAIYVLNFILLYLVH